MFLMRCLFTMFAEDVGLLPEKSFKEVLEECERNPEAFTHDVGQLWEAMDLGTWAHVLKTKVKKFNGEFFRNHAALPLGREEIGELRQAASYTWKEVDPSIFGTLVEQALDPEERKRLGAHYTPAPMSSGWWSRPSLSRCARTGATCRRQPKPSAPPVTSRARRPGFRRFTINCAKRGC